MRKAQHPAYAYIEKCYGPESTKKQLSRSFAENLNLGGISISQTEAHFLRFLLKMIRPRKIVEIGTLTGLSCQYFLESLQEDGIVYSLDKSTEHLALAGQVLGPLIDQGRCVLVEGDAREKLKTLQGPFNAIFIDGNKAAYADYWSWASENITNGGLIMIDNVFLSGAVWGDLTSGKFSEKQVLVMQQMTAAVLADTRFLSSFVPTEEGLLLAYKR